MAALYEKMAADFAAGDLKADAIEPLVSWFHGVAGDGHTPWPKKYSEMDPPLQVLGAPSRWLGMLPLRACASASRPSRTR